ncbi:MAG: adenosine monophosphate-protein transferase [Candidatus Thermoplasmatota archaeon]|jgi:adenosine/AMP kinase|nr:adenosine monophosphate-protein transferase [Candidatus Thermoplasmatota archaeon]MCL5794267.1 adenosine monophosphate-protein transferase [Candidatus Thermoplasmatota archaeon]
MKIEIESLTIEKPEDVNVILGYSHFIKTVEDLGEIIRTHVPQASFGLAFSEASGPRLVRSDGNSTDLVKLCEKNLLALGSGHTFLIMLRGAYPISVLNAIKSCQEVGNIYAATSNRLTVIVARTDQGGGILGVIDGNSPLGVESIRDRQDRIKLLRDIGYKLGP